METKKDKEIFWVRFVGWVVFCLLPIVFVAWRYGLFSKVTKISVSGWALFCGLILFVFLAIFLNYLLKVKKWAYWKQIVKGVLFLILPLSACLYGLYCARDTIDQLLQVLGVCILCWTVAIVINPMPGWTYEVSKGETADMFDYALDRREQKKNASVSKEK